MFAAVKATSKHSVVFVTAPDLNAARQLARAALQARLAACVNLVPKLESHYWWQGNLEHSAEVLLVFKTTKNRLSELEKVIVANHPYDTPEFVVLPLVAGATKYLAWLSDSVKQKH